MASLGMGVIGVGVWGARHAHALRHIPSARLRAVCDVDGERAETIGRRYQAERVYQNISSLLDDTDVDAVSIALPDHLHTDTAIACISSGRHVLIEKPLALSVRECQRIADAAEANRVKVMVDFTNRWNPPFIRAKELIEAGLICNPRLMYIRMNNTISVPTTWLTWPTSSSVLWWIGSHAIDLARWLFADEVATVAAVAGWGRLRDIGIDTADYYVTTLRFRGGGVAIIENCWTLPNSRPGHVDVSLEIITDTGMITANPYSHRALECFADPGATRPGFLEDHGSITLPDFFYDFHTRGTARGAFMDAVQHFVTCIQTNMSPDVTAADGTEVTRIIVAALSAAQSGGTVHLDRTQPDEPIDEDPSERYPGS
jgi:predicted dehydrogenase